MTGSRAAPETRSRSWSDARWCTRLTIPSSPALAIRAPRSSIASVMPRSRRARCEPASRPRPLLRGPWRRPACRWRWARRTSRSTTDGPDPRSWRSATSSPSPGVGRLDRCRCPQHPAVRPGCARPGPRWAYPSRSASGASTIVSSIPPWAGDRASPDLHAAIPPPGRQPPSGSGKTTSHTETGTTDRADAISNTKHELPMIDLPSIPPKYDPEQLVKFVSVMNTTST